MLPRPATWPWQAATAPRPGCPPAATSECWTHSALSPAPPPSRSQQMTAGCRAGGGTARPARQAVRQRCEQGLPQGRRSRRWRQPRRATVLASRCQRPAPRRQRAALCRHRWAAVQRQGPGRSTLLVHSPHSSKAAQLLAAHQSSRSLGQQAQWSLCLRPGPPSLSPPSPCRPLYLAPSLRQCQLARAVQARVQHC